MGCGSSKLKGDGLDDLGTAPQPVRKTQSNFKDVDFTTAADPRKGSMPGDVAPHETGPPKGQKKDKHEDITAIEQKDEDAKLEPYKTLTDANQAAPLASSAPTPDMIR